VRKRNIDTEVMAKYFQDHRDDDAEWEETPEDAVVERSASIVYSLRIGPSELAELRRVASARGVALSELIRTSALQHIRESDAAGVEVSAPGAPLLKFITPFASPSGGTKSAAVTTPTLEPVPKTVTA